MNKCYAIVSLVLALAWGFGAWLVMHYLVDGRAALAMAVCQGLGFFFGGIDKHIVKENKE